MITYEHANSIGDRDNWIVFWPQCRILQVNWMFPDPEEEGNKVHIRWIYDPDKIEDWPEDETPVMQRTDVHPNTECFRAFQESFPEMTDEEIEKLSFEHHEIMIQRQRDFEEYVEYKANGNLKVEVIDETKPISWNSIRDASSEELFQTKLEIFESPPVQETEQKEYRANIRKSESIIEAMYWYYLIVSEQEDSSSSKTPHIDDFINPMKDEDLFKLKLQIFEREEVQNSENKDARSQIRKSNTLMEMLIAYNELTKE